MQIITSTLKVSGSKGVWSSLYDRKTTTPEIVVGVAATMRFDLRQDQKDDDQSLLPYPIDQLTGNSYYFVLDVDFSHATVPKLLLGTKIKLFSGPSGETYLDVVLPNTATSEILAVLCEKRSLTLNGEIGGYDGEICTWAVCFDLILRNRVWIGNTIPEDVQNNPEYLTSVQVKALIDEATRSETPGPAGTTPHVGDNGNWWIGSKDTGVAAAGKDGVSPHVGDNGNWWIGSKDTGVAAAGKDGKGLQINAVGELTELAAYDDMPAGFVFAAAETDSSAKTTTKYIYVKKSDEPGDWFDPLIDVSYERTADVVSIPPVEFSAPTNSAAYLQIDLTAVPNTWLSAVVIDTAEGELQLLPGAGGIRKVLRKDGQLRIYFGAAVPAYSTGRIFLSRYVGLPDTSSPNVTPGFNGVMYYGYIPAETLNSVTSITADLLDQSSSTVTRTDAAAIGGITMQVPAYSFIVALVPSGLHVQKGDGIGGKTTFIENNGAVGTGSNGQRITIDGVEYCVYGELQIVTGAVTIFIEEK